MTICTGLWLSMAVTSQLAGSEAGSVGEEPNQYHRHTSIGANLG